MNVEQSAARKARQHTVYKTEAGLRVPGVTTVLGVLNKPALVPWANKLGLQGINVREYVDALADVGKLAHAMVLEYLSGGEIKAETGDYSRNTIGLAENCFIKYLEWDRQHKIEPIYLEMPLISERHRFGGTADFYGRIDGRLTLLDFKTGKGIYDDYWIQLAGYKILVDERFPTSPSPEFYRILNIGRDETEQFKEEHREHLGVQESIFLHALAIYQLQKEAKS